MIMEAARAMLHDQDLPMNQWAEIARIVMYVQNRTPQRILDSKTPEEAFSDEKPEVSHLIIFGYLVYIHIPKEKRTKTLQERRAYLWDIVKARRLTEYTF